MRPTFLGVAAAAAGLAGCGSTSEISVRAPETPVTTQVVATTGTTGTTSRQPAGSPDAVRMRSGYRLRFTPVVLYSYVKKRPVYAVYLRLNKPLPRRRGMILLENSPYEKLFRISNEGICYNQDVLPGDYNSSPALKKPFEGKRLTVTVGESTSDYGFMKTIFVSVRVRLHRVADSEITDPKNLYPRLRKLGCPNPLGT